MLKLIIVLSCLATVFCVPSDRNGRIVGGNTARPGQFPYQASLRNRETGIHFCGAFIINERWVGSSFRCTFFRQPAENILVAVGSVTLSAPRYIHQAIKIVGHPEYRAEGFGTYENDISLVQIKDSFTFSDDVRPVPISSSNVQAGTNAYLAG